MYNLQAIGKLSTWRNKSWRGNSGRLRVYSKRLYLPSTYQTESSIIRVKRVICNHQVNSHRFGCSTRKNSHCWKKRLQKNMCVRWVTDKNLKAAQRRENKNWQSRNRNSTTPENWEELILLIWVTKNTKASFRKQGDSWWHKRQL